MYELMDKGFLLACCFSMDLMHTNGPMMAISLLSALSCSAANTYWNYPWLRGATICLFLLLGIWEPVFLLYAPLFMYDIFLTHQKWFALLLIPPILLQQNRLGLSLIILILLFSFAAYMLKQKTTKHLSLTENYNKLRDNAAELTMKLESTNKELRLHQDDQVHSVMLMERNRIAREIHDNVGHLLSSAMLQLGALLTVAPSEGYKEPLHTLKNTLSEAMSSIRQSVHGLHDESIDLQQELSTIVRNFSFCPAVLDYAVNVNPDRKIKYAFLAIVKEALSNAAKHSNATQITVTVREHPALFQLDIRDNGTNAVYDAKNATGIGLTNITDRITDLHGRILITTNQGFHIFISVPKEKRT